MLSLGKRDEDLAPVLFNQISFLHYIQEGGMQQKTGKWKYIERSSREEDALKLQAPWG